MTKKPTSRSEKQNISASNRRQEPKPWFISLRWRFISPLFLVVLIIAMIGAYLLANNLGGGLEQTQINLLLGSSAAVSDRAALLYDEMRSEAIGIAFTMGVLEAVQAEDTEALVALTEARARLIGSDSVLVADARGVELVGLLRVEREQGVEYALNTGTDLASQPIVRSVLDERYIGATGLLDTPQGTLLYTAVPILRDGLVQGIVMVGTDLQALLVDLQGGGMTDLALYDATGQLAQTTLELSDGLLSTLALPQEIYTQALAAGDARPVASLSIDNLPYQVAYAPFQFGPQTLGVIAALLPDDVPFAFALGRQLTAVFVSVLAGSVVVMAFVAMNVITARAERIKATAQALAAGQFDARTGMRPSDEVSAVGAALDTYADYAQERQDALRTALRRQRREASHLIAALEAVPDGIIVQDNDGRVMLMNETARGLLGSQRVFRTSGLHELTAVVTDVLGASLAPGLYALGDPRRVDLDGRMLSAQAAAIAANSEQRVGTVIVLRDISEQVRREQAQEQALKQLARDVQEPLLAMARKGAKYLYTHGDDLVAQFTREIARNTIALQKLLVEMRELTHLDVPEMQRGLRALRLETLVWAVANEWRQIAQANNLTLYVLIEQKDLYVLGDERRLRWALGNIIDNAIKYTPAGGALTLEIKGEENGQARLRIRDNGVGIAQDELPHIFKRFYRGTPVTKDGRALRMPGMGQGLSVAREIFEAHGGTLRVRSTQWVGTAVYMTVPLTANVSLVLPRLPQLGDMDGETVALPQLVEQQLRGL